MNIKVNVQLSYCLIVKQLQFNILPNTNSRKSIYYQYKIKYRPKKHCMSPTALPYSPP
jgi:hypothetical protein